MGAILQSLLIYSCVIAVFASLVHSKGRHLNRLAPFEFLFLFMPWLTVIAMAYIFFGSVEALYERTPIWIFFWLLQVVGAAVVGSFVLMPRYFVKAETVIAKVLVNTVAGLSISIIFAFTRLLLFALTSEVSAHDWPGEISALGLAIAAIRKNIFRQRRPIMKAEVTETISLGTSSEE